MKHEDFFYDWKRIIINFQIRNSLVKYIICCASKLLLQLDELVEVLDEMAWKEEE